MMIKKIYIFLLITFIILGCKGKNNQPSSEDLSKKDTLNINIGTEPPSLDWSLATDSTSYLILNNIMEGLTRFGEDYKAEPALAKSWDVSKDGKTYTFH
ncbi:MAG: peptide ABC transporter substrate-binding protein, partial [Thermodesulfobacteriota bacterium]